MSLHLTPPENEKPPPHVRPPMRRAGLMTIRTRLVLWYSALLTITIVILALVVITVSRVSVLGTIDEVLNQTSIAVMQNISVVPVGEFGALETHVVFKSDEIFRAPGISVQVWQIANDNESIEPNLLRTTGTHDPLDATALHTAVPLYHSVTLDTIPARVVTTPYFSAEGVQMGVVQTATSIQAFEQANDALLIIIFVAAAVTILVSMGMGMMMAGRALIPVERVTQAAASIIDAKDLSTRLTWHGPDDELGQLIRMFNHMMQRLEHLFSVQQRFVADVSHEMRTPLTSILGNLEVIQRYGFDKESLDAVHREADRMSRMVSDLLLLARADNGELQMDLTQVDLDGIVLEVYEQAHILAKGRNVKIALERLKQVRINGNPDRLRQLILNLISNAIKFTPDGGKVSLALYPEKGCAVLDVADTGIGISDADMKRIFDRFFQVDHSRVHRDEEDGAGLGLSIVRWIVEAHTGKIEVFSRLGEGTLFRVQFPLIAAPPPPDDSDEFTAVTRPALPTH
jgi:two-component system, OmpR family, sensor kinase